MNAHDVKAGLSVGIIEARNNAALDAAAVTASREFGTENHQAVGVRLEDGRELRADAVISTLTMVRNR